MNVCGLFRRHLIVGILACGVTFGHLNASHALDEAAAETLINTLMDDINHVATSGKPTPEIIRDFEAIFAKYSDTAYIAAYVMGVDGRRATPRQKQTFSKVFQSYVARKYGKQFRDFVGGRLEIRQVNAVKKWYEVEIRAFMPNQSPIEMTFRVHNRTGQNLFFNMFVEGVNLLLNERTEIGTILEKHNGDIDALITELEQFS